MEQINNNLSEQNNIRNKSIEHKVNFVKNVISQIGIPLDFKPIVYCIAENIFYQSVDGKSCRREWVLFQNNKFHCGYCLCFSALEGNRFVKGVEYVKGCRITSLLQLHARETHHQLAKNSYWNLVSKDKIEHSEKRNVIKIIVKIVIFIATHG